MVKIKWNVDAFREIRHAPGVVADIDARAARVAAAAGAGYESSSSSGGTRHRGFAGAATTKTRAHEVKHGTAGRLVRALDAGR